MQDNLLPLVTTLLSTINTLAVVRIVAVTAVFVRRIASQTGVANTTCADNMTFSVDIRIISGAKGVGVEVLELGLSCYFRNWLWDWGWQM